MKKLAEIRIREDITQAEVGPFYWRRGVSPARICQIERSVRVSREVERRYRLAVKAAIKWRQAVNNVQENVSKARREFAADVRRQAVADLN